VPERILRYRHVMSQQESALASHRSKEPGIAKGSFGEMTYENHNCCGDLPGSRIAMQADQRLRCVQQELKDEVSIRQVNGDMNANPRSDRRYKFRKPAGYGELNDETLRSLG